MRGFSTARLPRIVFGEGRLAELPELVTSYGRRALLVIGSRFFAASPLFADVLEALAAAGVKCDHVEIAAEPSPAIVDQAVARFRPDRIEVVVAIGGGSVLDAAKAIAGLLPTGQSVLDHLEEVGRGIPYRGPALPLIAAPTTAGTGSEATRNAVISAPGRDGFKRSFRHDLLVPQVALVDPQLTWTCPSDVTAASGMDAITQLLEAYVSPNASPFTDPLATAGLAAAGPALVDAARAGAAPEGRPARSAMAYAALLSGICLAQAGLGAVHGLASPLGAFFPIPHGAACGTLVAAATAANIAALGDRAPGHAALSRYAEAGRALAGCGISDPEAARCDLIQRLARWTEELGMPRLGAYGVESQHVPWIVRHSRAGSMKTNPIELTDEELASILYQRL